MGAKVIAGVVAEFNPFHSGHARLLERTRQAGATHIVAVMSGNFVQRGGPACAPKLVRANAAVAGGADLVVELPLPYAGATAQRFAFGAVEVLAALGCVQALAFGSECGDVELLEQAADAVDSPYCDDYAKNLLDTGIPYAQARQRAVEQFYGRQVAEVLSTPNNILGVEYLRQLRRLGSPMQPFTLPREGVDHDAAQAQAGIASASLLRELLEREGVEGLAPFVPAPCLEVDRSAAAGGLLPFSPHSLDRAVLAFLRRMDRAWFGQLPDISGEGLDNRLYEAVRQAGSLEDLYALAKTKRYPLARIRRLVWNGFLGVPADLTALPPPYIRVLSMGRRGMEILSAANHTTRLPVSHSLRRLEDRGGDCTRFARLEALAADLYALGLPAPPPCGSEYTHRIQVR